MQTAKIRDRGHLPHWEIPKGVYFVTFRLAGSLPAHVLDQLRAKLKENQLDQGAKRKGVAKFPAKEIERLLDSGLGPKHLLRAEIADAVERALRAFDGARYELFAWCIMPNHAHVVFRPIGDWDLAKVMHSWKSFTTREAQRKFGLRGAFWQREYYDRLIRDCEEFRRAVRYVVANPSKAGLEGWRWVDSK